MKMWGLRWCESISCLHPVSNNEDPKTSFSCNRLMALRPASIHVLAKVGCDSACAVGQETVETNSKHL